MTAVTSPLKTDPKLTSSIKSSCVLWSCFLDHCPAFGPIMLLPADYSMAFPVLPYSTSRLILYKSFPLPTTKQTISIFVGNTLKVELFDLTTIFQPFSVECMKRWAVLVFFYWPVSDLAFSIEALPSVIKITSSLSHWDGCCVHWGFISFFSLPPVLVRDTLLTEWYTH